MSKDRNSNGITCRGRAQAGVRVAGGYRENGQGTRLGVVKRGGSAMTGGSVVGVWAGEAKRGRRARGRNSANSAGESAPGYQLRRWSKTKSGTGAGASSQLATGSGAGSHSGGPRARATWGGVVGSPRCVRIDFTAGGSVTKAISCIWAPHSPQRSGKTQVSVQANARSALRRN